MTAASASRVLAERVMQSARSTFVEEGPLAYSVDPVFHGLRRNRVNAELLKAALRIGPVNAERLGYGHEFQVKIAQAIMHGQKDDGGWHEIHPNYDEPSALATAFMAESLLEFENARTDLPVDFRYALESSVRRARDYVLKQELRPGFFLKSEKYRADHINVDASIGAFLAQYAKARDDEVARSAARRAAALVVREQFPDGAWPYTTAEEGPPYPVPIHVPCIHYQGVTGYYLAKLHMADPTPALRDSLVRASTWLAQTQRPDGRFDWSRSHMMFAYQLSGAYAFACALFSYTAQWEPRFHLSALAAVRALEPNVPGLALRWERARGRDAPRDIAKVIQSGWHSQFPIGLRAQRVGHGIYRQLARQRYAEHSEDQLFHFLRRTFRLTASTVEPSKNFPDLFMSAEIADCLAFSADATLSQSSPPRQEAEAA